MFSWLVDLKDSLYAQVKSVALFEDIRRFSFISESVALSALAFLSLQIMQSIQISPSVNGQK